MSTHQPQLLLALLGSVCGCKTAAHTTPNCSTQTAWSEGSNTTRRNTYDTQQGLQLVGRTLHSSARHPTHCSSSSWAHSSCLCTTVHRGKGAQACVHPCSANPIIGHTPHHWADPRRDQPGSCLVSCTCQPQPLEPQTFSWQPSPTLCRPTLLPPAGRRLVAAHPFTSASLFRWMCGRPAACRPWAPAGSRPSHCLG